MTEEEKTMINEYYGVFKCGSFFLKKKADIANGI
jgi:hypothetical protein